MREGDRAATSSLRRVELALEQLGSPSSQLPLDTPTVAEIVLTAQLLDGARPDAQREQRAVGRLLGSATLDPKAEVLRFEVDDFIPDPGLPNDPEPASNASSVALRRALALKFSEQFVTAGAFDLESLRVRLPGEPEEAFRHLELSAELKISGAVEGASTRNDVLDVPLIPKPVLALELVDEIGEPLSGVLLKFAFEDKLIELTTDAKGRTRIDQPPDASALLNFDDFDAVKQELKKRWDKPRPGGRVRALPGTLTALVQEVAGDIRFEEGVTRFSIQPRVLRAELLGATFDTSKAFPLPSPSLLAGLRGLKALYDENPNSILLIVGHCDTAGSQDYNDKLSLERADAMKAYLTDDVDAWVAFFGTDRPVEKRWGSNEDTLMLGAQPDSDELLRAPDPLLAFQNSRGLTASGKVDDATRRELIKGYMSQDGTTLPADVEVVVHGAGENFPAEPTPDNTENGANRRVELFFFDAEFGVQPAPPGKNSKKDSLEYPEWRRRSLDTKRFLVSARDRRLRVRMQLDGAPLAGKDYQLFVDDFLIATGTTDGDGLIEQSVPSDGILAVIRLPDPGFERVLELTPRNKFPGVESTKGVKLRLRHLGFFLGEVDGFDGQLFDEAVLEFKKSRGLALDSQLDDATRKELVVAYGS